MGQIYGGKQSFPSNPLSLFVALLCDFVMACRFSGLYVRRLCRRGQHDIIIGQIGNRFSARPAGIGYFSVSFDPPFGMSRRDATPTKITMKPKKTRFFFTKQWWADLSTNFFGALLGIVVTFGTTGYLEYCDKKAMGRTAALMTIGDIEYSIRKLETDCETFLRYDTVFRAVLDRYPDRLDEVPADTLSLYLNSFFADKFYIVNPAAEGVFAHSSDIWRTLDNYALQQRIGHCFALRNKLNDFSVQLQRKQKEAAEAFFTEKFFGDRKDFLAAVRELTGLPSVRQYFALYPLDVEIQILGVRQLRAMNDRNIQDMNITREELEECLVLLDYGADVKSKEFDDASPVDAPE